MGKIIENLNGSLWKVITAIIIPVLFLMGTSIIANDKDSRGRDIVLAEKMVDSQQKQQEVNQAILLSLKEIQVDLRYIKKNATD